MKIEFKIESEKDIKTLAIGLAYVDGSTEVINQEVETEPKSGVKRTTVEHTGVNLDEVMSIANGGDL